VRVALACPYAWDAAGGVQVHIADLASQLRARGHDVLVLAPTSKGPKPLGVRVAGRSVRVPYRGTVAPIAPMPTSIVAIRRVFGGWHPDVVHVHEPLTPSTSMWATLASDAPVVATFHAWLDRSRLLELSAPLLRPVVQRIRTPIAVSEAAASFLATAFPDLAERVEVVPNGVDLAAFANVDPAPLPEGRRIVWVHRLDPQKGFATMLAAFERIADAMPDARLIVAGDGPQRDLVERLAEPARGRVQLLGAVAHERVPGLFAAADVAVAPATGQESFGIVLIEAMAAGAPVVASDIEGYREVIRDRASGLLVPPGDAEALAQALLAVLGDPALGARLAEGGRARAGAFDWATITPRLEGIYAAAIGGAGPPIR